MSAHVSVNLLNELVKEMRGLSTILSLFRNEFYKFNNTGARLLDYIHRLTIQLLLNATFLPYILYLTLSRKSLDSGTKIFKPVVVY